MGKRASKEVTQHRHACRRARERFDLCEQDVRAIERMIRAGRSTVVERQSIRRVIHEVTYLDMVIHVAYDTNRNQVATFLHPEGNPLDLIGGSL